MPNVYFELTEEFNRDGTVAVLSSGQAVVWYRLAMMSKDGDWIVREDDAACARIRQVLSRRGARYRPGAPLAVPWLQGGWSSHFEFLDARGSRVRCDFVSRPPRLSAVACQAQFQRPPRPGEPAVVDLPSLLLLKQTQRAKDYPILGALARLLGPAQELEFTTDPDRVLELAGAHGDNSPREAVQVARQGGSRDAVVVALAREADRLQQQDRVRVQAYLQAGAAYLRAFQDEGLGALALDQAHPRVVALAERLLPATLP